MCKLPFMSDDLARWSAPSILHDGYEEFEFGYGIEPKASMLQAAMGQDGPELEATSGICLLIPIYVRRHKVGLLIHLWRDEQLSDEGAELIRKPFEKFPELADGPIVGFVSSEKVRAEFPDQIKAARELIKTFAPSARFHDIDAETSEGKTFSDAGAGPMSLEVSLHTKTGELKVWDDYGSYKLIEYHSFPE
jgi:hypothetical protein